MELRHLRYFVAVAEELHFVRAAERLHMEQSPLSRAIRNLEHDLGVRLLERTTRSTRMASAGTWCSCHQDHSRVSFALIKADERSKSCALFLRNAVAYYAGLGVRIDRVTTNNDTR